MFQWLRCRATTRFHARKSGPEISLREARRPVASFRADQKSRQSEETLVGEGGTSLPLGQRQLVCFIRALIADPRILILDEATSSVDSVTESRL